MAKTYDTYKDSGIAWIGEIPSEWVVKRLKFSCKLYGRIGFRGYTVDDLVDENDGAITLSPTNFDGISLNFSKCSYLSWTKYEESPEIMVNVGDVLIVKTASVGKCAYVSSLPKECTVNPQILVLKEHKDCAKYIAYIFQTELGQSYIEVTKGGSTIFTISQEKIGNYSFMFPPISDQQSIASFLDKKCGEIDALISLQEEMIRELQAYKQSVITEAVTKGLNPHAKMKDSGVEWIGEIPEGWNITKIKRVANTTSGSTPRTITNSQDATIKWFRTTDINENIVADSPIHLTDLEFSSASCSILKPNTCLVAMYGGAGSIGKFGMLSEEATINQALCSIDAHEMMHSKYIFYILKSIRPYWMKFASGTRKDPNINQEIVRNMVIPVPPLPEQHSIATFLDEKTSQIDSLISLKQQKIQELKDYKKSIIYEYVTGKKRV